MFDTKELFKQLEKHIKKNGRESTFMSLVRESVGVSVADKLTRQKYDHKISHDLYMAIARVIDKNELHK